ncbi:MAG: glutathione S-transferase family protein [Pseudomonadota bacterium]
MNSGDTLPKQITLTGFRFSVYTRIARVILLEKKVAFDYAEVNPFGDLPAADLARLSPFGLVPVLSHGARSIYETSAIGRYLDASFSASRLTPTAPFAAARMTQVIAVLDNHGYRPMIRQVFAHRVFRRAAGAESSAEEISEGLKKAKPVLAALSDIVTEGEVLDGRSVTLADCHLAPMMAYFCAAPEGAALLDGYPPVAEWWARMKTMPSLLETDPGLPK